MDSRQLYQLALPAAGIVYVIVIFLLDWNGKAIVVGALLLGLLAVIGSWMNRHETRGPERPADAPPDRTAQDD